MKVAVVGLGSMGRRRVRLIKEYVRNNNIDDWVIFGVDSNKKRCDQASVDFGIGTFSDLDGVLSSCDAVVVSTSPLSHSAIVNKALKAKKHVFSEINLVADKYDESIRLSEEARKVLFLSSTFLYREEIAYIAKRVSASKPGSYMYHVGQYLPDWHPWEDYRSFFVADKRTNACRELFAIELPWIQQVFGEIVDVVSFHKKGSTLSLPYDDSYALCLVHENGTLGSLQVDVVSRKAVRNFEFSSEDLYLTWNGSPEGLQELDLNDGSLKSVNLYEHEVDHQDNYASFIIENAYYSELEAFFRTIDGSFYPKYGYLEDAKTLELIDRIEG